MNEEESKDKMSLDEERKKLKEMGVSSTWDLLKNGKKKNKKSEDEKKPAFRGFN